MGNMYDGLLVEVTVDFSRREIVTESEIRIDKETQLYRQLIEGCIFFMKLRYDIIVAVGMSLEINWQLRN
jgi:predicted adenine nucleotide alpha hydrolase (AANH) superfamily ATPase